MLVNKKLTTSIISEILSNNTETVNEKDLLNNIGNDVVLYLENRLIKAFCIIIDNNRDDLLDNQGFKEFYSSDYNEFMIYINKALKDGISIVCIESFEKNKKIGTMILESLKKKYKSIFLYSAMGSESYWEKNNFEEVGLNYYLFN